MPKYRDALIVEGCNVELVDRLANLHVKLKEAKTAQELFKKERGLITQECIEKLNGLYE